MRNTIYDAIEAWRDGETADAIHPLSDADLIPWLYNPDIIKDLAHVIARHIQASEFTP